MCAKGKVSQKNSLVYFCIVAKSIGEGTSSARDATVWLPQPATGFTLHPSFTNGKGFDLALRVTQQKSGCDAKAYNRSKGKICSTN